MRQKNSEIPDQINGDAFRAVLRTELSDDANMITVRYVFSIKSSEDKEERQKAGHVAVRHLYIKKDY